MAPEKLSMPGTAKLFLSLGGAAAMLAVTLGAFGAHTLKATLGPDSLALYHTGIEYHFYHSLGLIAVGIVALRLPDSRALRWAGGLMAGGVVLFSGSLYLLALTGAKWLGALTPFGGVAFLLAWLLFAAAALKGR